MSCGISSSSDVVLSAPAVLASAAIASANADDGAQLKLLGHMSYSIDTDPDTREKYVWVSKRVAYTSGKGFGTRSTRYLMQVSFDGCEGRMRNSASYSSHIFHLYMGMMPQRRKISLVCALWGRSGKSALDSSNKIVQALKENLKLNEEEARCLKYFKRFLEYKDTGENDLGANISNEDVIRRISEIDDYKHKTVSNIEFDFIPKILDVLEESPEKATLEMDTRHLGSIIMEMSEEGIKRWKAAIDTNTPFTPFRRFEHLRPHMSGSQIEQLNKILAQRDKISAPQVAAAAEEKAATPAVQSADFQ